MTIDYKRVTQPKEWLVEKRDIEKKRELVLYRRKECLMM